MSISSLLFVVGFFIVVGLSQVIDYVARIRAAARRTPIVPLNLTPGGLPQPTVLQESREAQIEELVAQVHRNMDLGIAEIDRQMAEMQARTQAFQDDMVARRVLQGGTHNGNLVVTGNLTIRGGTFSVTPLDGSPVGTVVIRPGPGGNERVTQLRSGGVSIVPTDEPVPPEPVEEKPPEKLPPTIYERLNQDDD